MKASSEIFFDGFFKDLRLFLNFSDTLGTKRDDCHCQSIWGKQKFHGYSSAKKLLMELESLKNTCLRVCETIRKVFSLNLIPPDLLCESSSSH